MAVTLTVDDLLQPLGELDATLFSDLDDLVAAWLAQAIVKVEAATGIPLANQNEAAAAWVYYRAYSLLADRMASTASTIMVDGEVTRSTSSDQRRWFADRARYWLDWYNGLNTLVQVAAIPAFFSTVKARRNDCTPYQ